MADLTYVPVWSGFACTALVVDAFSQRIVGWKVAGSLETGLALDALEMAIWTRGGQPLAGLVHHSDRGGHAARLHRPALAEPRRPLPLMVAPNAALRRLACFRSDMKHLWLSLF